MADTGSTLNGIHMKKKHSNHQCLLRQVEQQGGAECTRGGIMDIEGEMEIAGEIDEHLHVMAFKDMPVSMPIASMHRDVDKGNRLQIHKGGRTRMHRKIGRVVKLHERMGLYFVQHKEAADRTTKEASAE